MGKELGEGSQAIELGVDDPWKNQDYEAQDREEQEDSTQGIFKVLVASLLWSVQESGEGLEDEEHQKAEEVGKKHKETIE